MRRSKRLAERREREVLVDAPPGHVAHEKVKLRSGGSVGFTYRQATGIDVRFRVAVQACDGEVEEAERIARLCYLRFVEEAPLDAILRYRDDLCTQLPSMAPRPAERRSLTVVGTKRTRDSGAAKRSAPADAPRGHPAHKKARVSKDGAVVGFDYVTDSGERVHFQTTAAACGGCRAEAERICRLCYMKFEEGWAKGLVLQHRAALYRQSGFKRICGGLGVPTPLTRSSAAGDEDPEWTPRACRALEAAASQAAADHAEPQQRSRPPPATPWPALHGDAALVADACARRGRLAGFIQQMGRRDASALTALQHRFCRRRAPSECRQVLQQQRVRDFFLDLASGESAEAGLVVADLAWAAGECLAAADVIASGTPALREIWRDLEIDDVLCRQ